MTSARVAGVLETYHTDNWTLAKNWARPGQIELGSLANYKAGQPVFAGYILRPGKRAIVGAPKALQTFMLTQGNLVEHAGHGTCAIATVGVLWA